MGESQGWKVKKMNISGGRVQFSEIGCEATSPCKMKLQSCLVDSEWGVVAV